ncbi:MAG: carboxypeptidase regulatory-like domain-containing protein, partial [Bacteroidales bacterium]|nr:carboxypeptidase regulatory-like domain-containing protein [Bacteroidales bacterium]
MSIKHLLIISFIFSAFILTAQKTKKQNELDSILLNNKVEFRIHNLNINTKNQDFGTAYYKDKIVFTSSRAKLKLIQRVWFMNDLPFLNLYVAEPENSELIKVKPFGRNINKKYNEGPASFNEAGNFMAFTRNNYKVKNKNDKIKLQIFTSKFKNNEWTDIKPMNFNSNKYSVGHPALTADGNTMYFASDMPGGFGGVDIYVTNKNKEGQWSKPINLGSDINTKGDEMFPFIYENSFLFFASDGLGGLGGLDLFYVRKKGNIFTIPKNIGAPINSSKDDFAFILNKKMTAGYFSSDRKDGKGSDDIYSFVILNPVIVDIILKGKAVDNNNKLLANTNIILSDAEGNKIKEINTDKNGEYKFDIQPNTSYTLEANKTKYKSTTVTLNSDNSNTIITQNLILEAIQEPEVNVNFICRVSDKETKEPIANAKITVNNPVTGKENIFYTDDKGEILIKPEKLKLKDSLNYKLTLEKESYTKKIKNYETIIEKAGNYILNINMQKTNIPETAINVILEGKTLDKTNIILENTDVSLFDGNGNIIKTQKTNKTGEFKFKLKPETFYRLKAKRTDYKDSSIIIDSHAYDTLIVKNINLDLIPEFNFICKVADKKTKEPIQNTKITIHNLNTGKENILFTDYKGAVSLKLDKYKLNDKLNFTIVFQKKDYSDTTVNYDTVLLTEGNYKLNVGMQKMKIIEKPENIAKIDSADIVTTKHPVDIILKGKAVDNNNKLLANTNIILSDAEGNKIKEINTDKNGE